MSIEFRGDRHAIFVDQAVVEVRSEGELLMTIIPHTEGRGIKVLSKYPVEVEGKAASINEVQVRLIGGQSQPLVRLIGTPSR